MFVALDADEALPVSAPTNDVDVTDDNPAIVVAVPPKATGVEPIVTLLLTSAPFGMLVMLVPEIAGEPTTFTVTAPVEDDMLMFDPATSDVTPVFEIVRPEMLIPVPPTYAAALLN